MEKLVIVSADGHAGMPPALWSQYLDERYHDFLPTLQEEAEVFGGSMGLLNDLRLSPATYDVFDKDGLYQSGRWQGLWDASIREQEMDREGVAAELVYPGDFRAVDLGYNTMNGTYPSELVDAGVRAFDRWVFDTFGHAPDRFLLVGPSGTYSDMDAALEEAAWVADHGFVGTFAPGFTHFPGMRPLDDEFWEPLWSRYEELGLTLVVHGGYGFDQGVAYAAVEAAHAQVEIGRASCRESDWSSDVCSSDLRRRRGSPTTASSARSHPASPTSPACSRSTTSSGSRCGRGTRSGVSRSSCTVATGSTRASPTPPSRPPTRRSRSEERRVGKVTGVQTCALPI